MFYFVCYTYHFQWFLKLAVGYEVDSLKRRMIRFILYSLYGLCSLKKISMIFGSFYSSIHCNLMKKSDYIFPIVFHRRKKVIQGSTARLNNSLKNKSWVSEESEPAVVRESLVPSFWVFSFSRRAVKCKPSEIDSPIGRRKCIVAASQLYSPSQG